MPRSALSAACIAALLLSSCARQDTPDYSEAQAAMASAEESIAIGGESPMRQAIETLSGCVEQHPAYAPCHALLARAYTSIGGNYNILSPEETWAPARRAAEAAMELDSSLALSHLALAEVLAEQDRDWAAADREYQRALEIEPTNVALLLSRVWFQYQVGRSDEARATHERLVAIDPAHADPRFIYGLDGDAVRAAEAADDVIAADPENPDGYWTVANIHAEEGQYDQAAEMLEKQIPLMEGDVVDEVALLGWVFGRMGREDDARRMLDRLDEVAGEGRYVSPIIRAWIHAGLDETDTAIELLQEGVNSGANRSGLNMIGFAYVYVSLRDDPRYAALLEEIGLPW